MSIFLFYSDGGGITNDGVDPIKSNSTCGLIKKNRFSCQNESTENTLYSDNESDSDDIMQQTEYLEERIAELMIEFKNKTNEMIDSNFNEFIETYPKAITNSTDDSKVKELSCVKAIRSSSVVGGAAESMNVNNGRRRSIQPCGSNGDRLVLSSADLERLQKVADESIRNSQSLSINNSVCREAAEFLESSNDMHPLRVANANKAQEILLDNMRKLRCEIDNNEKCMDVIKQNIADTQKLINDNHSANGPRANAKKNLQRREIKLKSEKDKCTKRLLESKSRHDKDEIDILLKKLISIEKQLHDLKNTQEISLVSDKKMEEYQQNLRNRQKELKQLTKDTKKKRKMLEEHEVNFRRERLKDTKEDKIKSSALTTNLNTRITQLDNVLKEKREYLRVNNGESEKVETIRHEIRNLRDQRDRLTDAQCILNQKLKKEKKLSEREARQILEYDVAKEVIDHAMELKNLMICGRDVSNKNTFFLDNPDLMKQLSKLHKKELTILLYKCFQKIVDLRDSTRQLEIQAIQWDQEKKEYELRELNYLNRFEQLRLEQEQHSLHLGKQHEATVTKLLQTAANNDYGVSSIGRDSMLLAPVGSNFLQILPVKHRRHHTVNNGMKIIHGINHSIIWCFYFLFFISN